MVEWEKIKAEYIRGGTSYRKLAEKFGVPFGTLKKIASREGWAKLRTQADEKAVTKLIEEEVKRRVERGKRIDKACDSLLSLVEKVIKEVQTGNVSADRSLLKQISGTLKDIKDIQGRMTELDAEEKAAKIKLLKKQAESDNNAPNSITVRISGGDNSWQN